jgi:cell division protein FtsQ
LQSVKGSWTRRLTGKGFLLGGRRGVSRLNRRPLWRPAGFLASVPRGAGLFASVCYLLAWGGYGMVLSGQTLDVVNDATARAGFGISAVRITGQREIDEADVLDTLSIHSGQSLFLYDATAARERLQTIPWVQSVSVMKLYPNTLRVILEERVPSALWQRSINDPVQIVDSAGKVISGRLEARYARLPRVVGEGAEMRVAEISSILDDVPELQKKVRASMLVSHRRWDLFLDNGVQVMLPETDALKAAQKLEDLDRKSGLLARDITVVDLRLPDRVTVRLSDTAAQARAELVAARNKALKQRERDA